MRKLLALLMIAAAPMPAVAAPAKGDPAPQVIGTSVDGVALDR